MRNDSLAVWLCFSGHYRPLARSGTCVASMFAFMIGHGEDEAGRQDGEDEAGQQEVPLPERRRPKLGKWLLRGKNARLQKTVDGLRARTNPSLAEAVSNSCFGFDSSQVTSYSEQRTSSLCTSRNGYKVVVKKREENISLAGLLSAFKSL